MRMKPVAGVDENLLKKVVLLVGLVGKMCDAVIYRNGERTPRGQC